MNKSILILVMLSLLPAGVLAVAAEQAPAAEDAVPVLKVKIYAGNWSWQPDRIRVRQGTRVILEIENRDAPHAFLLKAYRLKVHLPQDKTTMVEFMADKPGKFTWRCGRPCGNGCPKMRGTLEVLDPGEAGS